MTVTTFEIHINPDDFILRVFCFKCVSVSFESSQVGKKPPKPEPLGEQTNCPHRYDTTLFATLGESK